MIHIWGLPRWCRVKNLLWVQETQETWVWSLGQEDSPGVGNGNPLQDSCLKKLHGQRSLEGYTSPDRRVTWATEHAHTHPHTIYICKYVMIHIFIVVELVYAGCEWTHLGPSHHSWSQSQPVDTRGTTWNTPTQATTDGPDSSKTRNRLPERVNQTPGGKGNGWLTGIWHVYSSVEHLPWAKGTLASGKELSRYTKITN